MVVPVQTLTCVSVEMVGVEIIVKHVRPPHQLNSDVDMSPSICIDPLFTCDGCTGSVVSFVCAVVHACRLEFH